MALYSCAIGYLPIYLDPAGVCFMSDVQALASDSDAKPPPLKTFGNTNRFFVVPMLSGAKIKYNFQTRKKNNEKDSA